jgi:NitT/TauT family transport system permease protein
VRRLIGPGVIFSTFIGAWYALAYGIENNFSPISGKALVLPPPHRMFEGVTEAVRGDVITASWITFTTASLGLIIATMVAWSLALVMAQAKWLESSLWPFLVALQAVPIVALVPLIIQIVGVNNKARVLVVVLIAFFPLVSTAIDGLNRVPRAQEDLFRLYGANKIETFLKLRIPNAIPFALSGVRVSAGLSVVGAVVADFFFARGDLGLGRVITEYFQSTQPGPMILASAAAALLGGLFFSLSYLLQTKLNARWSPQISLQKSVD